MTRGQKVIHDISAQSEAVATDSGLSATCEVPTTLIEQEEAYAPVSHKSARSIPSARQLRSKARSRVYNQRKPIVEPVNGQIKEAR